MTLLLYIFFFLIGLALLYFGAEWLVAAAGAMALRFGIAPLIVGLTVVAFGTSAPELLVSLLAIAENKDGISVGNIIGSNIANIALILGCAALVHPIDVHQDAVKRQYPIMLAASILLVVVAYDLTISRVDGTVLLVCMAIFLIVSFLRGSKAKASDQEAAAEALEDVEDIDPDDSTTGKDVLKLTMGIVALAGGAYFLVESAVYIAKMLNVPDLVIGITLVAVGTSLPELATSVVAAYRGESDISVGNVIGSNVFNILLVLGVVSTILPIEVNPKAVEIDLWVMLAISIIIWPLMRTGFRISRIEGACLLVGYVGYMIYLFVR